MTDAEATDGYHDAIRYLYERINYERRAPVPYQSRYFKLDRMRRLLGQLGDPHRDLQPIHIAGSKGKGSVAALVAAALTAAGYRTALFTSPHLEKLEERFAIDGMACSPAELVALVEMVRPAVAALDTEASSWQELPTFFEMVTAMALVYFQRKSVDVCVLETGLGGRLDATNVCSPSTTIVTSISLDHTRQLGSTLEQIAGEKAGIIKPGVPAVTGVVDPGPLAVIERTCRDRNAPLWRLGREFTVETLEMEAAGTRFRYRDEQGTIEARIPLLGTHQAGNAAVALAALRVWEERRVAGGCPPLCWSRISAGLARAQCRARIELLGVDPPIVLDAAHNPASIDALLATLRHCFPRQAWVVVFGTSADKDAAAMLTRLAPFARHLILTRYQSNPRGAVPTRLKEIVDSVSEAGPSSCRVRESPVEAWEEAGRLREQRGLGICVAGSFFLAADLRSRMVAAGSVDRDGERGGRAPLGSDRL